MIDIIESLETVLFTLENSHAKHMTYQINTLKNCIKGMKQEDEIKNLAQELLNVQGIEVKKLEQHIKNRDKKIESVKLRMKQLLTGENESTEA